jgi:undecaprenyl pyrophosphate phosphatase UppP
LKAKDLSDGYLCIWVIFHYRFIAVSKSRGLDEKSQGASRNRKAKKWLLRTIPFTPFGDYLREVKNVLRFTVTGIVCGFIMGGVLLLGSGNYYVTLAVGLLGLLIGVILGIVHRNDPSV